MLAYLQSRLERLTIQISRLTGGLNTALINLKKFNYASINRGCMS